MIAAIHELHDAARRYCMERAAHWRKRYSELCSAHLERKSGVDAGNGYSDAAYEVFPRYHVLDAILMEVEGFTPEDFQSFEEAKALISAASETAESAFTRKLNPIAEEASKDERRRFQDFILASATCHAPTSPPLPFRRVLSHAERADQFLAFERSWGKWYGGDTDSGNRAPFVTLHEAVMCESESYDSLRSILEKRGVTRVFELREDGDGFELDLKLVSFLYDGSEGFWKSNQPDWMVYASHESSITFGGNWLIGAMQKLLPNFDRYIYRGWNLAYYS